MCNEPIFSGKLNADEFLNSLVDRGSATVNASELRNLLISKRKLGREVKALNQKLDNQISRNDYLKGVITELRSVRLEVTGIDIEA